MGSAVIVDWLFSVLEDNEVIKNKGGVVAALVKKINQHIFQKYNRSIFYSIAEQIS